MNCVLEFHDDCLNGCRITIGRQTNLRSTTLLPRHFKEALFLENEKYIRPVIDYFLKFGYRPVIC